VVYPMSEGPDMGYPVVVEEVCCIF
jgi:hypothetical protein